VSRAASAKQRIREYASHLGIDGMGSCDAEPLVEAREAFESAVARGLIPVGSAPRPDTIARLTTPRRHLRGARSVLSAFEYYHKIKYPPTDPSRAVVAAYTRANHYLDLRLKLETLADFMQSEFGCRTKVFSCYVTLAEKPLACKSGIGFYGKHGVIITPGHGSYVVLGEVLTDLDLEPDEPLEESCGTCTACMDACPTGAIVSPYLLDRGRCIQYISERRGTIPMDMRDIWGNRFYGCSTCQDACPKNSGLKPTSREVSFGWVGDSIAIREILEMDDRGFSSRFRDNQIAMRDLPAVKRNAVIAAGNSGMDSFVPALRKLARDRDPMIRQHSLWAVAKIGGPAVRGFLDEALRAEADPEVLTEIKTLLDGLGRFA
jgi:epoxyqueuosine reductase